MAAVEVLVSLGSNVEPARNLQRAVERIASCVSVIALSSVFESDPVGAPGTPRFWNAGLRGWTELGAFELKFERLRGLERELGRERVAGFKAAPRTIDLDLVAWGEQIVEDAARGLHLPSIDLEREPYVLIPLAEIAPRWRHPRLGRTLAELAAALEAPQGMMRVESFAWQQTNVGREGK